jgi:teichuronic acid exporter
MKGKAINGIFWSFMERFSVQGVQFILTLFIARILSPSDYGLIAMLGIFVAIAQTFVDSGFSIALIQKQNRTEVDYSTAFYFNVIVGIFLYLVLYFSAPFIASFYNEKLLDSIVKYVGLGVIINSLTVVQLAKLTIEFQFKKQAIISFFAALLSGSIAILMAYNNFGVWALVWQNLLSGIFSMLMLWICTCWFPRFCFSIKSFKELFSFGSKLLASGLMHTIYTNIYSLVIGKCFTASELGLFNRAISFSQFPSMNIGGIVLKVFYPIECEMQNDDELLQKTFFSYIRMVSFVTFPLMCGLCALAKPIVLFILTDKWLQAVPLLQILCLSAMWEPIKMTTWSLLNAKHRTDFTLKSEIIKKIVAVIILAVTMPFGIKVMAIGLIFYALCDIYIVSCYTQKILSHVTFKNQLKSILPTFLLASSMGFLVFFITLYIKSSILAIIVGLIVGVLYYVFIPIYYRWEEMLKIKLFVKNYKG